ncbi:MAG TPA: L-erythro-3,5-diaminohexanoate dehydrogenase [Bdellovibrionales bacterium]|nr:MAG: L-erythro-3,5-diaminohexanoate dehydrogenase [Bdellovibrionales bacterium GWB1_52_6]OFZ04371.1 MAG: L-erythro-3,5-diaminohexanoate dehydrogenase [Bdellovibrionales bacterium GWA1_52_35]OFZ36627.1 MAG: L-erythro-3,5-diaminohexanoate dehydrogenase [Bdellovibrionales bacterium GWC1_52_8]HAR44576.1 L-erythro-3,5-diaminohexanoate dehydrogenase [Bdellovibrionales bacterium]HCM40773.1 L-erythro-3,5-diaminohexanoate dehydrogenase [Bdellovibrionales bacterium]
MTQNKNFRTADPLGIQRVVKPKGVLPQQAETIDASLPIAEDELLIEVESLNIDSASFHQISEACGKDVARMEKHILDLVANRGKHHNPVTGSGGMLIGKVVQVGPHFPVKEKPVREGDRIATLVSLSLTPLQIRKIKKINPNIDRVDIEGHAILFASGIFAKLPEDMPETVALAVLDVAGAPAQTRQLVQPGQTVVVVGGGGKSGILCLYEAKKKAGVRTVAIDYSQSAIDRLAQLPFVDEVIQADARNAVEVMEKVWAATKGHMGDVVINVANIPETEMSCVLSCAPKGIVYFFSMATSFTRAALGAEGVGADVDLRIGNGYTEGHADLALDLIRESEELRQIFTEQYV